MQMVGMCAVVIGAEHDIEPFARRSAQPLQELFFGFAAACPIIDYAHMTAIGKNEARYVDRIAITMLG